jgi:hypothetical protein
VNPGVNPGAGPGNATRHLRPGDRFALAREAPHAERHGDSGAVYWVARRG